MQQGFSLMTFMAMLLFLFFVLVVFTVPSMAVTCEWTTSCTENTTSTGLLRGMNQTDGWNDAHAQLMNYTGTAYNSTLCCVTDGSHRLNNSCSNENATVVLGLADTTNNHVQVPGIDYGAYGHPVYNYSACLALSPGNLTCEYVNSTCDAGYEPLLSIASSETNDGLYNLTNAHIANYTYYTLNVCCKGGNAPPTVPTLLYPTDNNATVFERNVTFDWEDSTDPDNDPITYDFNLTSATCSDNATTGLGVSTYQPGQELCVDVSYNWTVRACDASLCSDWATPFNFTVKSVLGLAFTVNNTDFGELARNATDNTTDNNPLPFLVENTGNVPLNVTFKANDPLFETSGLGNNSFQYEARVNESGAYSAGQETWTNVSASYTALFTDLGYADSADAAAIDILVKLPYEEPAGTKSSIVQVLGQYG